MGWPRWDPGDHWRLHHSNGGHQWSGDTGGKQQIRFYVSLRIHSRPTRASNFSCYFVLRLVGGYSRALCVQMFCIWSDCFWCVDVLFVVREITFRIFVVAWLSCCVLAMPIDFVMGVRMVSTTETMRPAQRKTNNKSTTKLLYGPLYKLLPLPSTSSTLDESEMGCSKTLGVELLSLNGGTQTWRACILGCSFLMCSATLPWIFMISSICTDLQFFHICATCHRISLICIQLTWFRAF